MRAEETRGAREGEERRRRLTRPVGRSAFARANGMVSRASRARRRASRARGRACVLALVFAACVAGGEVRLDDG